MHVRLLTTVSLAALAAFAICQSPASRVQIGLAQWAGGTNLKLRLSGTVRQGQRQDAIEVQLLRQFSYSTTGVPVEKIEIIENINGILAQRIVADGMTLSSWTPSANQVSSSTYGSYSPQAQDTPTRLGDGLASIATGYCGYPVRFYRDIFFASGPTFRTWMPGGTAQMLNGVGVHPDPVNPNRNYVVSPNAQFALFTMGQPANRSLAFEFDSSSGSEQMTFAYYTERKPVGAEIRVVDWQMSFSSPAQFPAGTFTFVPPVGARLVAGPKIGPLD